MKKALIFCGTAFLLIAVFIVILFHAPKGTEFTKTELEKTNNKIVFVWEGLEKDIPKDGEYIQITGTDENTVYLNAIDE